MTTHGCGGACVDSLNCPYPQCIQDYPGHYALYQRNLEIKRARERGATLAELSKRFGLGQRQIVRILKGESPGVATREAPQLSD